MELMWWEMFLKVQRKASKGGSVRLYACVVENRRVKGKTVQRTVINIGLVTHEQVPYLKAAWAQKKPRLVWD